jgi:hypothetical protein
MLLFFFVLALHFVPLILATAAVLRFMLWLVQKHHVVPWLLGPFRQWTGLDETRKRKM